MIAQNGDLGIASYVSQAFAAGSIGLRQLLLRADHPLPGGPGPQRPPATTPSPRPQNVAVSLLQDKVDTTDTNNPALYLTQKPDGRLHRHRPADVIPCPPNGYLNPADDGGERLSRRAKGATLAAFSYYAMCQGQQQSAALGYSPMPINLVQAAFAQIAKIPGATSRRSTSRAATIRRSLPRGEHPGPDGPYPPGLPTSRARRSAPTAPGGRPSTSTPVSRRPAGGFERRRLVVGEVGPPAAAAAAGGAKNRARARARGRDRPSSVTPRRGRATTRSGSGDASSLDASADRRDRQPCSASAGGRPPRPCWC